MTCPCGSNRPLASCCGRFHAGEAAPDPETLMRSRYSAFVGKRADYLLTTWHPRTRPAHLSLDEEPAPKWLGLTIKRAESAGDTGLVEFVARHRIGGRAFRLHETSRFERVDGRWYYLDGELHSR
ncbi:MAG TPA: YchJ family metal-binding protein [Rhodocyclaceae bacterium]